MNKLSFVAVIATLALAAPALAQTPADRRNFRTPTTSTYTSSEVKLDHAATDESAEKTTKHSKKSKKHSKKSKKHHSSKTETKTETKTEEKK